MMRVNVMKTLAALLLLICILVSCVPNAPPDTSGTGSGDPSSAPASTDGGAGTVGYDGYTVVRPDMSDAAVSALATKLRTTLVSVGYDVAISTDYTGRNDVPPADACEILIGETNRAPSSAHGANLGEADYKIARDGSFIVICGGSALALDAAVDYFISNLTGKLPEKDYVYMSEFKKIDNSSLIPKYVPDADVKLVASADGVAAVTPDWTSSLIMTEVHIETATSAGTLEAAIRVLDHCAEAGINGIWLTPVYAKGSGNGYGNMGPHTIEPKLTGKADYTEGFAVLREFIDEAHKRGIRVLLDIITWGTTPESDLFASHPDWYSGEAWGGKAFNWNNTDFVNWFVDTAYDNIMKTGADGYRCDCEPNYTGYNVFNKIRAKCLAGGRKILIMAEDGCQRGDCFDLEQDGVLLYKNWGRGEQYTNPKQFYLDTLDIVESVKSGEGIGSLAYQNENKGGRARFYTYCVSNHDYQYSSVNLNRLVIGYQAIFAPFIPLWYLGGEFGMKAAKTVIYFTPVDWSLLDAAEYENVSFFEDVKSYIRIRRTYADIFEYFPTDHRDSNICDVQTDVDTGVTAYARYAPDNGKAVIIVPNKTSKTVGIGVTLPTELSGIDAAFVTDLLTGIRIPVENGTFTVSVQSEYMGVYLIEKN